MFLAGLFSGRALQKPVPLCMSFCLLPETFNEKSSCQLEIIVSLEMSTEFEMRLVSETLNLQLKVGNRKEKNMWG